MGTTLVDFVVGELISAMEAITNVYTGAGLTIKSKALNGERNGWGKKKQLN